MAQARVLSDGEVQRVMAMTHYTRHTHRNAVMFQLTLLAGLRACEVAALRVRDVYEQAGAVKRSIVLSAGQTKGSKGNIVYVSNALAGVLSGYYDCVRDAARDSALLPSQRGGHMRVGAVINTLSHLYHLAGIEGASSHSGRRTFITKLADSGINARVIQALARHAHLNTTQRYIDINDAKISKALEMVFG